MERVDGNALAGLLAELFVPEMTTARCRCGACGRVEAIGAGHAYAHPLAPGAVLRCLHCDNVLLVAVRRERAWRLTLAGAAWIELAAGSG